MEREVFARRFDESAQRALEFARGFLVETLPDDLTFRLRLNSSYDANLRPGEVVFPEDGSRARATELHDVDRDTALDTLWRDGRVPEWVSDDAVRQLAAARPSMRIYPNLAALD